MKKLLLLLITFNNALTLFSQTTQVIERSGNIGLIHNSAKEVQAKLYSFEADIASFRTDSAEGTFTVQLFVDGFLSKKRKVIYYDYRQSKLRWEKSYRNTSQYFGEIDDLMFSVDGLKFIAINPENGQNSWEIKSFPYYITQKYKIAMGYDNNLTKRSNYNTLLSGFSLIDGKTLWQRNITRVYGWNDLMRLNDSTYILAANGLHSINIKTGSGWDYETPTGETGSGFSFSAFDNVKGDRYSLARSNFHIGTGNDLVYDVCSNIVKDTSASLLYFVSSEKIACLDYEGKEKWAFRIPQDIASTSNIFKRDSILYVINEGLAHYTTANQYGRIKKSVPYGRAYLAAFNRFNGTPRYFDILEPENKPILDYVLLKDTLTIVYKDKLVKYNIVNGEKIRESNLNLNRDLIYGYVGRHVFIKDKDSLYQSVYSTDTTGIVVYSKKDRLYLLDNQLNIKDTYTDKELYYAREAPNGVIFLRNDKETLVLNKKYKVIATLYTKEPFRFSRKKAYFTDKSNLVEIDLDSFLE